MLAVWRLNVRGERMNKVFIVGNLTKAPEMRTTQSGVSVATFTVAVQRRFKRGETDFLNVVAWRGLADNCGKYLVKGQKVAVCGEIQTRSYDGQDGSKRYITEVVAEDIEFLNKPNGERTEGPQQDFERYVGEEIDLNIDDVF